MKSAGYEVKTGTFDSLDEFLSYFDGSEKYALVVVGVHGSKDAFHLGDRSLITSGDLMNQNLSGSVQDYANCLLASCSTAAHGPSVNGVENIATAFSKALGGAPVQGFTHDTSSRLIQRGDGRVELGSMDGTYQTYGPRYTRPVRSEIRGPYQSRGEGGYWDNIPHPYARWVRGF